MFWRTQEFLECRNCKMQVANGKQQQYVLLIFNLLEIFKAHSIFTKNNRLLLAKQNHNTYTVSEKSSTAKHLLAHTKHHGYQKACPSFHFPNTNITVLYRQHSANLLLVILTSQFLKFTNSLLSFLNRFLITSKYFLLQKEMCAESKCANWPRYLCTKQHALWWSTALL